MLCVVCFFIPSHTQDKYCSFWKKNVFFFLDYKTLILTFCNISVVTSRNSKYLRKFAFLFNMENFDSWGNFLIIHPSESKLGAFSNWHPEKLQHRVRFLS